MLRNCKFYYKFFLKPNFSSICVQCHANSSSKKSVCIVGSGPAGFYTAQHLLKDKEIEVDIYEKLPVPFGLIRYGVAPDHPEIKNVTNSFTKTALDKRCRFYGNVNVGQDVSVVELSNAYHAVVLAFGASKDKMLGIPGENSKNVLSAYQFIGWYNGHPEHINEKFDLNTDVAVIVGHGNVALDIARILLKNTDELKTTDISEYALESLKRSKIKRILMVGRRGPLQASFAIKEFREITKLSNVNTVLNVKDFEGLPAIFSTLPRPRKRLTELMYQIAVDRESKSNCYKSFEVKFFRSPKQLICDSSGKAEKIVFGVNKIESNSEGAKVINTDEEDVINCNLVFRSVGYQSTSIDASVPFDTTKNIIPNTAGRVIGKTGLYCSGWIKTGPVGVILSTMHGSYETAENILDDIQTGKVTSADGGGRETILKCLKNKGVTYTTFSNWLDIDKIEQENGKIVGKTRLKIYTTEDMLKIAKVV